MDEPRNIVDSGVQEIHRQPPMRPRRVDVNEIIRSMVIILSRTLGQHVCLQLRLHPTPLVTLAFPGMLEQVLLNQCVNSRDAMRRGGGVMTITTAETTVKEGSTLINPEASPGNYISLSVTDTGGGILPRVLPMIFEPFFTTKDPGRGSGLGLSAVLGIVTQHRGWINVDNHPGKGVTFQIVLPAVTMTAMDAAPTEAEPKLYAGTETILLVEDEAFWRKAVRELLKNFGYQVLEAANVIEAKKCWELNQKTVSLLLAKLELPGFVSGQQLAWEFVAQKPQLKIIYITNYSPDIASLYFRIIQGESLIQRPYLSAMLLESIRRCLDGKKV